MVQISRNNKGTSLPLYPNTLRSLIELAGYSFREVSEETKIPERTLYDWASGKRVIPRKDRRILAIFLGCTIEDLAPCSSQCVVQLPQNGNRPQEQEEEMDKKRRTLLYTLSIASSSLLLPLPHVDWEGVEKVVITQSLPDESMLHDLKMINHHYWRVSCGSSSKIIAFDGVLGQLQMLTELLKDAHTASLKRKLNILASDIAQLAGEIFFDKNDYHTAQSCYAFAAMAAKEASHYDLWACALVRNAFLPIYNQQYSAAFSLLSAAEQIAAHGDTSLVTRHWISAVAAEAYAGYGNAAACQKALEYAERVQDIQNGGNGGWLRFDGTRLPEQRGACFVHLQQSDLAVSVLKEALMQHPTPTRRRGMVLNDLAQAMLLQKEVEQACLYAHEVIEIASQRPSGVLKKGLQAFHMKLEPFSQMDVARTFNQHLNLF